MKCGSVFPVWKMFELLKISRSGYYEWPKRSMSKRKIETQLILAAALKSHRESKCMCGLDKTHRYAR